MVAMKFNRLPAACRHIHIVGGPGSGKTTLSRQLSLLLGLPVIEIDEIRERNGLDDQFRPLAPLAQRVAEITAVASQPAWVTEGAALWWTEALFDAADLIVWLDIPWRVAAVRIVKRHFVRYYLDDARARTRLSERLAALRYPHLGSLLSFIRMARAYYREDVWRSAAPPADVDDIRMLTRASSARYLASYESKVIHCQRAAEPAELVRLLTRLNEARGSLKLEDRPPHHDATAPAPGRHHVPIP